MGIWRSVASPTLHYFVNLFILNTQLVVFSCVSVWILKILNSWCSQWQLEKLIHVIGILCRRISKNGKKGKEVGDLHFSFV